MNGNGRWLSVSRAAFASSWTLACLNVRYAPYLTSYPMVYSLTVGPKTYPIGGMLAIPLIALVTTVVVWAKRPPPFPWFWRQPAVTLPVVALGALALLRSWPVHRADVLVVSVGGVLGFWAVYAYTLCFWSSTWVTGTLGVGILIQACVALAQFVCQRSVGLTGFGELVLDPQVRGASVLEFGGHRWLRAYGLLPHPNVLGGFLGFGLIVCVGAVAQASRKSRWLWGPIVLSMAGLFVSFSRSAWLGTLVGLVYLVGVARLWRAVRWYARKTRLLLGALVIVMMVTGVVFGGLLGARLGKTPSTLEQNSLAERLRDIGQAWMLIRHLPLKGVGTGYYVDALWAWAQATGQDFPAFQEVHNVPLLLSAQMGIPSGLLWLWLVGVLPLRMAWKGRKRPVPATSARWGAALTVILVVGMLDSYPDFLNVMSGVWLATFCGFYAKPRDAGDEAQPAAPER